MSTNARVGGGRRRLYDGLRTGAAMLLIGGLLWTGGFPATAPAAAATGPKAYVGLYGSSTIGVLDLATGRVLGAIKVPAGPEAVVVAPDGRRVYVSSEDATQISMIDTARDAVVKTLDLGGSPEGMALSRDGKTLLAAVFEPGSLAVIDTATFRVAARIPVAKPHGVALTADARTAYIGSQDMPDHNAIVAVDLPDRRIAARIPVSQAPRGLTIAPDGASLYFTEANSADLTILDTATKRITGAVTVGPIPHQIVFTPDRRYALVAVQATGRLAVVDAATRTVVADVPVGTYPHWVAPTPDGKLAYVTNEGDNTVSVVDLAARRVIATLLVGDGPRKIGLQRGAGAMSRYAAPAAAPAPEGFAAHPAHPAPASGESGSVIHVRAFAFDRTTITVHAGQTVTWVNQDVVPHTSQAKAGAWNTGQLVPGAAATVTFSKPGTYAYFCGDHPFMEGTVVVTP
jgi:YVTN family beta-propeller protein